MKKINMNEEILKEIEKLKKAHVSLTKEDIIDMIEESIKEMKPQLPAEYSVRIIDTIDDLTAYKVYFLTDPKCNTQGIEWETLVHTCMGVTSTPEIANMHESTVYINSETLHEYYRDHITYSPKNMKRFIHETVKHEFRHANQFAYLEKKGGLALRKKAIELDSQNQYGEGLLEADAFRFQMSEETDFTKGLEELFADL